MCTLVDQLDSDEVEAGVLLLEAGVGLWWLMAAASSLSYQGGKSVGVADYGGFFDGSTDVVVGEAELVGERFEQVGRGADGVVDDGVASWAAHTLFRGDGDKVELVGVLIGDSSVDHGSRKRVLVASNVTCEEPGVDSLAGVDVDELACVG